MNVDNYTLQPSCKVVTASHKVVNTMHRTQDYDNLVQTYKVVTRIASYNLEIYA